MKTRTKFALLVVLAALAEAALILWLVVIMAGTAHAQTVPEDQIPRNAANELGVIVYGASENCSNYYENDLIVPAAKAWNAEERNYNEALPHFTRARYTAMPTTLRVYCSIDRFDVSGDYDHYAGPRLDEIWLNLPWLNDQPHRYRLRILTHELGHATGRDHPASDDPALAVETVMQTTGTYYRQGYPYICAPGSRDHQVSQNYVPYFGYN